MAEAEMTVVTDTSDIEVTSRIYEAGYQITPAVKEGELEGVISAVRSLIESEGGSFIAEGAPSMTRLSYPLTGREGGKSVEYDRAYFGWLKFESSVEGASKTEAALRNRPDILRSIVFRTVREDTRARMKAPTLREVRRTDTIKSTPRQTEEVSAPVSEVDLDKALKDITAE